MQQTHTTPVPNRFFDQCLSSLSEAEMKVLLLVIRQTFGWKCTQSGKRKERDWIAGNQFYTRTGLSRKAISRAINSLSDKRLIKITDYPGYVLESPSKRRGKARLYFSAFPKDDIQSIQTERDKLTQGMRMTQTLGY